MATIPDELMRDIKEHLSNWKGVTDKAEIQSDSLVYAIDLTVKYDEPETIDEIKI